MAITFQPQLFNPHATQPAEVTPANGKDFKLEELYRLLECDCIQIIRLSDELIMVVDDEGKFKKPCYLNLLATYMWYQYKPQARGVDSIVGRALICNTKQVR